MNRRRRVRHERVLTRKTTQPQAVAQSSGAYHLIAMSDEAISKLARERTARAQGPIIDQDGREIRAEKLAHNPRGSFQGRIDFGQAGTNPFGEQTRAQRVQRLEALSKILDMAFILPGTNVRYGIDGLIGLIPIVGDLITTAISLWIVREARQLGAPWHIVTRMLGNVAIDGVVGIVPFAGDAFDVMFRANVRNVKLLRRWLEKNGETIF